MNRASADWFGFPVGLWEVPQLDERADPRVRDADTKAKQGSPWHYYITSMYSIYTSRNARYWYNDAVLPRLLVWSC
jgi:hypothetical protein